MFEHRHQRLAPREVFHRRLVTSGVVGLVLVAISLAVGIAGYAWLEGLAFIDAFLNASMILSGMGPLFNPQTTAGKVFAGFTRSTRASRCSPSRRSCSRPCCTA